MPIGTSDGQQFDSEYEHLASTFNLSDFQPIQERVSPDFVKGVTGVAGEAIKRTSELLMAPGEAYKGNLTPDQTTESGIGLARLVAGASSPFASLKPGLGLFGGRFSKQAVSLAADMEAKGMSELTIKEMTGLERGAEGMWRREFSDINANYTPEKAGNNTNLGNVLKHEELYKTYPEAQAVKLKLVDSIENNPKIHGQFVPGNTILIKKGLDPEDAKSTILHELQHWVQLKEGFHYVTPEEIPQLLSDQYRGFMIRNYGREAIDKLQGMVANGDMRQAEEFANKILQSSNVQLYRGLSSEVEARNVQERMYMTPKEIKSSPATATEDIDRQHQIVKQLGGPAKFGGHKPK